VLGGPNEEESVEQHNYRYKKKEAYMYPSRSFF
jgi:hypothetical protein